MVVWLGYNEKQHKLEKREHLILRWTDGQWILFSIFFLRCLIQVCMEQDKSTGKHLQSVMYSLRIDTCFGSGIMFSLSFFLHLKYQVCSYLLPGWSGGVNVVIKRELCWTKEREHVLITLWTQLNRLSMDIPVQYTNTNCTNCELLWSWLSMWNIIPINLCYVEFILLNPDCKQEGSYLNVLDKVSLFFFYLKADRWERRKSCERTKPEAKEQTVPCLTLLGVCVCVIE